MSGFGAGIYPCHSRARRVVILIFFVGKVDFPIEKDANAQKEQREDIFYLQRRLGDQCRVSQGDDVGNKGNKQQPEA